MTGTPPGSFVASLLIGLRRILCGVIQRDARALLSWAAFGALQYFENCFNQLEAMVTGGILWIYRTIRHGCVTSRFRTKDKICGIVIAALLQDSYGGDINAVDKNGEIAMHGAAYKHVPSVPTFPRGEWAKG